MPMVPAIGQTRGASRQEQGLLLRRSTCRRMGRRQSQQVPFCSGPNRLEQVLIKSNSQTSRHLPLRVSTRAWPIPSTWQRICFRRRRTTGVFAQAIGEEQVNGRVHGTSRPRSSARLSPFLSLRRMPQPAFQPMPLFDGLLLAEQHRTNFSFLPTQHLPHPCSIKRWLTQHSPLPDYHQIQPISGA